MLRTSILKKSMMSSRYLVNHKKPIVQMPSHKPPKYIYKVKYHDLAVPTFDQGYRDHHHSNPFDELAQNDMQIFRFKYSGQWWYIGNFLPKLLTILFPFWLLYTIRKQGGLRRASGKQNLTTWTHIPQFPNQSKLIIPEF